MADKNTQNQNEKVEQNKNAESLTKDLDQGEELYTGFGFGNIDTDVEVPSPDQASSIKKEAQIIEKPNLTIIDDRKEEEVKEIEIRTKDSTDRKISSKITSEKREIPKETKVVIEPHQGNIRSHQSTMDGREVQTNYLLETEEGKSYQRPITKTYSESYKTVNKNVQRYANKQSPDYELKGVYFTNEHQTTNPLSLKNPLNQAPTINPIPIKRHYKNIKTSKKKQIPWKPIALGLAATIGAFKIITAITDDEDEGFIF